MIAFIPIGMRGTKIGLKMHARETKDLRAKSMGSDPSLVRGTGLGRQFVPILYLD